MVRRRSLARGEAGFSILEATVILGAMAIVAATAGSHLGEYFAVARSIKAKGDVRAIVTSVSYFLRDVGTVQGVEGGPAPSLLVGDGDTPEAADEAGQLWTLPADGGLVQDIYAHMVENSVGYRRWRGPYLEGLGPDPWGARYAINIGCLTASGTDHVTIVMSPGPDGVVDAAFRSKGLPSRQSDDLIGMISTGKDGTVPRTETGDQRSGAVSASRNLCLGAASSRTP